MEIKSKDRTRSIKRKNDRSIKKFGPSWIILGIVIVCMIGFGIATTVINDQKITGPESNFSQIYFGNSSGNSSQLANRILVSNAPRNITVCASGCDYNTIQQAINQVPLYLRHRYNIIVSTGIYNENLWFPPVIVSDIVSGFETEGSAVGLYLYGNSFTGALGSCNNDLVVVKSITINGAIGAGTPQIACLTVTSTEPTSDENVSISIYGSSDPVLQKIKFSSSNTDYGILAYASTVSTGSLIFNTTTFTAALLTKHNGQILATDGNISGNFSKYLIDLQGGNVVNGPQSLIATYPTVANTPRGFFVDSNDARVYGIRKFSGTVTLSDIAGTRINNATIGNGQNQQVFLIDIERDWQLTASGSAGSTSLDLNSLTDGKDFRITSPVGNPAIDVFTSDTAPKVTINQTLQIMKNSTGSICGATLEGAIQYDAVSKKFYGCNSTMWVALN